MNLWLRRVLRDNQSTVIDDAVPGWATMTASVLFLGGIQLVGIGILGEYIGRVFEEVKQRPLYLVGRHLGKK